MHVLIVLLKVLGYIVLFSLAVTLFVFGVGFVIEKTLKFMGYKGDAKDKTASILGALPIIGLVLLCGIGLLAGYFEQPVFTSAFIAFWVGYFYGFKCAKDTYSSTERRNEKDITGKATEPSASGGYPPNSRI